MQFWNEGFDPADPESPPHRVYRGEGSEEMSIRALLDSAGRIVSGSGTFPTASGISDGSGEAIDANKCLHAVKDKLLQHVDPETVEAWKHPVQTPEPEPEQTRQRAPLD